MMGLMGLTISEDEFREGEETGKKVEAVFCEVG